MEYQSFHSLETEYQQNKYFVEKLNLLEPVEHVLGRRFLPTSCGNHCIVFDCFYGVSLLQSIQLLLKNHTVQEQVFHSHKKTSSTRMRDFCDASMFCSHPVFSTDVNALQIQLYYDEIDVCNPIGSKSVIHKVGMFYYCLCIIDPSLRSRLQSIMLLAAVEISVMEKYGIDKVLEPFVEEMKQLESADGVPFEINNQTRYLRGALTSVVADNPASNLMGGFKNLSSAYRKCRHCLATSEDIQNNFHSDGLDARTIKAHERHIANLSGAAHDSVTTTYGVNRDSILNDLEYFHVTSGLPPDVMHDIYEGVAVVEIKCMLSVFIQKMNLLSLNALNDRIKHFPFGLTDSKSKPLPLPLTFFSVSGSDSLKQSSSQTWNLIRLLPFIIGDLIPEDNPNWTNFLRLREIIDYVCAPETTLAIAGYLRDLIHDHHTIFKELYPNRALTPKFHYMIHIPQSIEQFGPLVRMWCMRYEAKHRYFKRWAKVMGNFKNIPKTMASHHQRLLCYQLSSNSYLSSKVSVGPATVCTLENIKRRDLFCDICPSLDDTTSIHRVSWIEYMGSTYKACCVVLVHNHSDMLLFGQIEEIYSINQNFYLALNLYKTIAFDTHYHAYEVILTSQTYVTNVESIADHHPLWVYQNQDGVSYVPLKYNVLSDYD